MGRTDPRPRVRAIRQLDAAARCGLLCGPLCEEAVCVGGRWMETRVGGKGRGEAFDCDTHIDEELAY